MNKYNRMNRWLALILVLAGLLMAGGSVTAAEIEEGEHAQGPWPQMTVAAVSFQDQADLDDLAARLDLLESVDRDAGTVDALLRPEQIDALRAEGRTVAVDAQVSALLNAPRTLSPGQVDGIPGFACYRTVEETYASLGQLAAANPTLATWTDVGDSWDKATPGGDPGYDIFSLVLTNQAIPGPKPKLMIISAIHAREYATAELTTRFAELLVNNYGIDPDITWLLDYHELHLLPQANPDGRKEAESGLSWRKNVDNDDGCTTYPYYGTDLNRNSSFMWNQGGSSNFACDELYHGPSAASEPEVQTIEGYAASIFPDRKGEVGDPAPATTDGVFLTIHSYGELVLYPWGFTSTDAPNGPALATLGRKFGYYNNYEVCQDCLYAVSGATDDYTYGELGVPSYTFEIGTTFFQSCSFFEQSILPRNMPALLDALKAARLPYQEPSGPEVSSVQVAVGEVSAGTPVSLTASADDTRFDSNGYGNEPYQNVTAARFTVDTPPWADGAYFHAMQAGDGSLDSPVEVLTANVETTDWLPGRHTIYVQAQDGLGQWGVPSAVFLTIATPAYFHDTNAPPPLSVGPGETATHPLIIRNLGNAADSYTLTLTSSPRLSGPVQMTNSVGPVAPGASAKTPLTVQVPITASHGESQQVTVTVTSVGDPATSVSIPVTTTVQVIHGVTITPITTSVTTTVNTGEGSAVSLIFALGNTGNVTDTFELSHTSTQQTGWAVSIMPPVTFCRRRVDHPHAQAARAPLHAGGHLHRPDHGNIPSRRCTATASIPISVEVIWHRTYLPNVFR